MKKKIIGLVVAGVLAAAAWSVNRDGSHAGKGGDTKGAGAGAGSQQLGGGFVHLKNCSLVGWGGNDGDSFKIKYGGKEGVFRTYFVDCPEKGIGSRVDIQDNMRKRMDRQGRYFGNISTAQVILAGKEAQKFTIDLLTRSTFSLETKWERVMGGDRFHSFVLVNEESGAGKAARPEYLSKILVREGLARIYGKPSDHPDGTTKEKWISSLRALEAEARNAGRGAWRYSK